MGSPPPSSTYNTDGIGLPFYQGPGDFEREKPRHCNADSVIIAYPGDILLAIRGTIGNVYIAKEKCIIGRGLAAIRSVADNDYLYYVLKFTKWDAIPNCMLYKLIKKSDIENLMIPYPEDRSIGRTFRLVEELLDVENRIVQRMKELGLETGDFTKTIRVLSDIHDRFRPQS